MTNEQLLDEAAGPQHTPPGVWLTFIERGSLIFLTTHNGVDYYWNKNVLGPQHEESDKAYPVARYPPKMRCPDPQRPSYWSSARYWLTWKETPAAIRRRIDQRKNPQ